MKRVLLTGMSGTGKSTVISRLAELGYKVVDSDHGGFAVDVDSGTDRERLWCEDRIQELLSTEDAEAEVLFISGASRNQVQFYAQFDHIVLLTAPAEVVVERLHNRANNPYGKTPGELAETLRFEPATEKPGNAGDRYDCAGGASCFGHFGTYAELAAVSGTVVTVADRSGLAL